MTKSLSQKFFFHLLTILLVIINVIDINVARASELIPLFDLMAVFYFTIFKNIFGIGFIVLLGIWNDALSGNPLGATSLCYILLTKFFLLLDSRMLLRDNFNHILQQFVLFCFLFLLMKWVILSALGGMSYSLIPLFVQLILSSVVYVFMHRFFDFLSERLDH
ncbi:MAG: hypothetical protein FJX34_01945 [Alphaproteobacteria bacterium]|nr:hypothetical protein [Alphaproteobacteria bacterium]